MFFQNLHACQLWYSCKDALSLYQANGCIIFDLTNIFFICNTTQYQNPKMCQQ